MTDTDPQKPTPPASPRESLDDLWMDWDPDEVTGDDDLNQLRSQVRRKGHVDLDSTE